LTKPGFRRNDTVRTDEIIDAFRIDVDSSEALRIPGLKESTRVYRVRRPDLIRDLYVVDTPSGRSIACNPHLVGRALESACLESAFEAARVIDFLVGISEREAVVFEHVLRAGPGYELHHAIQSIYPRLNVKEVWIRPYYTMPSYRDHDIDARELEVKWESFEGLPSNKDITLLKPDTEATGMSGERAIERAVEEAEKVGSRIDTVVLYGFISQEALRLLNKTAEKHGFRLMAFAMEDVMQLAYNKYDMSIYGLDLSYWEMFQKVRKLTSITPLPVLEDSLPDFVPGSDQPGDFSSRQRLLFNGTEWERGTILCHLANSIKFIGRLQKISEDESWYSHDEIFRKKLEALYITLLSYMPHLCLYPRKAFSCLNSLLFK